MAFSPSIQSLVGDHSGGTSIGIDWNANRAFELNNTYLSRYGILTGLEEAYEPLADMGGVGENGVAAFIGVAANGNIFISASGSLYNGAAMYVNGGTLSMINLIGYPSPNFGQGGMETVTFGSTQFLVDRGLGDSIISVLNRVNYDTTSTWQTFQDYPGIGGMGCAGTAGTGTYYLCGNSLTGGVESVTFALVTFNALGFVSQTNIGTFIRTDIEPQWTEQFGIIGICLDQTDGKPIIIFKGVGGSVTHGIMAKVNPSDASVEWKVHLPNSDGGSPPSAGNTFAYSSITHQRVGFYTGSPAQVTIYDTSNGSVVDQYSNDLGGLSNIDGQCYNDSLGCIVLGCNFSGGPGCPTLLNSTPISWGDGYAVLYVAAPISTHKRRFLAQSRPTRIIQ
jgi:hypothetical protein